MENSELIKFEVGLIKRVSNAINVTSKVLALAEPQLIPYRKKDKWGFCTPDKRIVIDCIYDSALRFSEGFARVELNDKYGFINKLGIIVISCRYDKVWNFRDGLAKIERFFSELCEDDVAIDDYGNRQGEIGFIDKFGNEVINCRYNYAANFYEGFSKVKLNNKYGFIDKLGNEVIPFIYDYAGDFNEGLAMVKLDDKYGFIDKYGSEIVPLIYDGADNFNEGLARVNINEVGCKVNGAEDVINRYGFIDKLGNEVIPLKYLGASNFKEGLARVRDEIIFSEYRMLGFLEVTIKDNNSFIDKLGNEVIVKNPNCYYIKDFYDGLSIVIFGKKINAFIDKSGNLTITKYDED